MSRVPGNSPAPRAATGATRASAASSLGPAALANTCTYEVIRGSSSATGGRRKPLDSSKTLEPLSSQRAALLYHTPSCTIKNNITINGSRQQRRTAAHATALPPLLLSFVFPFASFEYVSCTCCVGFHESVSRVLFFAMPGQRLRPIPLLSLSLLRLLDSNFPSNSLWT